MADEYVELITDSLDYFVDEDTTDEEYEKITGMILETVTSCLVNAIEDIQTEGPQGLLFLREDNNFFNEKHQGG